MIYVFGQGHFKKNLDLVEPTLKLHIIISLVLISATYNFPTFNDNTSIEVLY